MNQVIREQKLESGQLLQLVKGDITTEKTEAIVNAANAYLQHGGGVAEAIVLKGGVQIQAESDVWIEKNGPVSHETPAYTTAGFLPCRYVIHAVGPIWGEGNEDAKLVAAVQGSLYQAELLDLSSISLPAISTGIFGFPVNRAAGIILATVWEYFKRHPGSNLNNVRIVLFDSRAVQVFTEAFREVVTVNPGS